VSTRDLSAPSAFLGVTVPSSRHQPASSLRQAPKPTASPPSTFLTSSTVWSDTSLRGFISPHHHVQGSLFRASPSSTAVTPRRCPLPSRWLAPSRYCQLPDSATTRRPTLRAFLRARVRCPTTVFSRRLTRFPLELLLLQVFPLCASRMPSHPHPLLAFEPNSSQSLPALTYSDFLSQSLACVSRRRRPARGSCLPPAVA